MKAKSMGCILATVDSFGLSEGTLISMQSAYAASIAIYSAKSRNAHEQKLISLIPSSGKKWKSL
jgi:hypothetical protein